MTSPPPDNDITYFETPDAFRDWLEEHHEERDELYVGLYKKHTGKPSITWPESVAEALCFGWIDGIRHRIDEERYCIRFTPRRSNSHWSAANIKQYKALDKDGRIRPAGRNAFQARRADRSAQASYEQREVDLAPEFLEAFKAKKNAWDWFSRQRPSYRKQCRHWVMSAKRQATREKRFRTLMTCSAEGEYIPPLKWTRKG